MIVLFHVTNVYNIKFGFNYENNAIFVDCMKRDTFCPYHREITQIIMHKKRIILKLKWKWTISLWKGTLLSISKRNNSHGKKYMKTYNFIIKTEMGNWTIDPSFSVMSFLSWSIFLNVEHFVGKCPFLTINPPDRTLKAISFEVIFFPLFQYVWCIICSWL